MFFNKTRIVNNFKSVTNWIISDISFQYAGDFPGQVHRPDSILFQILVCLKINTERNEWDVYGTTVIMTHDGSITACIVTYSNYNNRKRTFQSSKNEAENKLVCLCCSNRWWQLIWEEKPQEWGWIPRAIETTGTHIFRCRHPGTPAYSATAGTTTLKPAAPEGGCYVHKH